jgi:hypothetical protein
MRIFTTALLAAGILSAGIAAAATAPQYIGSPTGKPEYDTYGSVVASAAGEALCLAGPAGYSGAVTGNAEKDTNAYPVKLVAGATCPAGTELAKQ